MLFIGNNAVLVEKIEHSQYFLASVGLEELVSSLAYDAFSDSADSIYVLSQHDVSSSRQSAVQKREHSDQNISAITH